MTRRAYIPLGCDQQGRYPDRAIPPAECCTDIGAEPPARKGRTKPPGESIADVMVGLVAVIATVAALVHIVVRSTS